MKKLSVLWFSHFIPYPPKGGCFQRSYNLIKGLSEYHDVHLLALRHKTNTHPSESLAEAENELGKYCTAVDFVDISDQTKTLSMATRAVSSLVRGRSLSVDVFTAKKVEAKLRETLAGQRFDIVQFDTISLAQYLGCSNAPVNVMTHHGPESFMLKRRVKNEHNLAKKLLFIAEAKALHRFEREQCAKFDCNLVMSALDGDIMAKIAPTARFEVLANGVDEHFFHEVKRSTKPTLIFAGRMDQYSNRVGVMFFLEKIWPQLTARYPDIRFLVLGMNPSKEILELAQKDRRLEVTGFVDDIRPYFAQAAVCVCPNLDGGGTRLKILDALSMGMPIVSTSVGCEGISVENGKNILVADTPEEFVASTARLLDDESLRTRISGEARKLAVEHYSWSSLAERMATLFAELR